MTIDELLAQVREYRIILISEREVWPSPWVTRSLLSALRTHRKGLRVLLSYSDIATCASPAWHRPHWYHAGNQRYVCAVCERIAV